MGPLTLAVAGLAFVGAIGVWSAPAGHASPGDPALLLQCQGSYMTVSEPVYSVGGGTVADTATPEQIVDGWLAGVAAQRKDQGSAQAAAGVVKRTQFHSSDQAQISVLSGTGQVNAVVTMARSPELGWHIEVIHECA